MISKIIIKKEVKYIREIKSPKDYSILITYFLLRPHRLYGSYLEVQLLTLRQPHPLLLSIP